MRKTAFAFAPILALAALHCGGGNETTTTTSSSSSSSSGSGGGTGGSGGMLPDPFEFASVPTSCAYQCPSDTCAEQATPYDCPSLGLWTKIPHTEACEKWDGNFPTPVAGKCTATAPSGEAVKYAGADPAKPGVLIMPGGRRLAPAGADYVFPDPNDMTSNVVPIAGTNLVLTVDLGYGDHIVRVVDPSAIGTKNPTLGQVNFQNPESLNQGIAFSAPDRVYVAGAQGVVQALTVDVTTGQLTRDDARSITLPPSPKSPGGTFYSSGVAVSADNTRLFVSGVKDSRFLVADITAGAATYGSVLGEVNLGDKESFNIYVDPHDPTTKFAYVAMRGSYSVLEVDVSDAAAPKISRTFAVEKNPEGIVFLDARWMVVGNDLGDSLSLVDRVSGSVTTVPVEAQSTLKGLEPSSLAWDATNHRLYVTQAGYNALAAYDVDLSKAPPVVSPAGRLPTQWWPSGVVVMADRSAVVTSLMARGAGPRMPDVEYELLHGGIQRIPAPSAADLTAGEADVVKYAKVAAQSGYAQVQCPPGVDDFPIPTTNTGKPSPVIDHVVLIVRENKTFDGLFGDMPGVKGDPTMTMLPKEQMDGTWTNLRKLAKTFAHSDNFYTSAFISNQGHLWTTHGRTDDFNEREWPVTGYGRGLRGNPDSGGVADPARPAEGSLFDWLGKNNISYDILGEIVGIPSTAPPGHNPFDNHYPGGIIQSIGYPDNEKACYVAGRARVLCDLGNVIYMTLPNDHTRGLSTTAPTPETMFAVNDEATGMVFDALSHSPAWKSTLVIVVEDDPAQGGESVDYHRTILVMASPWVKRGYVSHAMIDISSVHKLIAHIFAKPYPNVEVEAAALPLDAFTATPDYTPYTYEKRGRPLACGAAVTAAEQQLTDSWDMDEPDEQPGLDAQIQRWLSGKQLTELTPALKAEIARRADERASKGKKQAR
ncbi:MAG: alkaline phosphatase family protein [Minicystis sp.]